MKRLFAMMLIVATVMTATSFAGEGKAKKCEASAEKCLSYMKNKVMKASYDGIYVKGVGTDKVVVKKVMDESPGALAGIQKGDVLAKMNGKPLANLNKKEFWKVMSAVEVGEEVTYTVNRNGSWEKISLTMTAMPEKVAATQVGWHMLTGHTEKSEKVAANY